MANGDELRKRGQEMAKQKYNISKEFFPLSIFTPKMTAAGIKRLNRLYRVPRSIYKDGDVVIRTVKIPAYKGGEIGMMLITPVGVERPAPCFINTHGGGFVYEATSGHYRHALNYAKGAGCVVAMPRYRLGPDYPFPYPQEDCYAALVWVHDHADELGIDPARIGIGGDSAGGTLAATSCILARDRQSGIKPLFQLLIYPFLDNRSNRESFRRFTDTPVWNSTLSKQVGPFINPNPESVPLELKSPAEADLKGMPPAYIEVAEFDALRDDGVLYDKLLREEGIETEFHDTHGTMHGFDYMMKAPTSQKMEALRIEYMKRMFGSGR